MVEFIKRGLPRAPDTAASGPAPFYKVKAWSPPSREITEDLGGSLFMNSTQMPSNCRDAKQPVSGWAFRVLWPSVEYESRINSGWDRTDYFKFIPSVGMFETFVLKED